MKLILAEKPSVARDLAKALGVPAQGRQSFRGKDLCISWALGHLVTLAEPHEIDPAWRKWRAADLPLLPKAWPLVVVERTAAQFEHIKELMHRPEVRSIIAATDAGREGELIFRYIYEKAACTKPVQRLWLSSLTEDSIAQAMQQLRPLEAYDRLADNARGRSRSDWLVGLNLSRAYSLKYNERWTVGRVQTPTLAMLVERTEAIEAFVPEPYAELEARFRSADGETYRGLAFTATPGGTPIKGEVRRFPRQDPELQAILTRAASGQASLHRRHDHKAKLPPPRLYDLTELQKDANRLYGFQAKVTLDLAQRLYEGYKLITYPRSDSRYLSKTIAATLGPIVKAIRQPYESLELHASTGLAPLGRNFVDDAKVSDHHAIIPTGKDPGQLTPDSPEARIFDLIARRLLMAWQPDYVSSQCTLDTVIRSGSEGTEDHFLSKGSSVIDLGWKRLEPKLSRPPTALPPIGPGALVNIDKLQALDKETRPPPPFNDASLLNGMASAGSRLDDKELTDILRDRGLGTPATRAAIIENLIQRAYIERREKALWATDSGKRLIQRVDPSVRSAALTGEWEAKLHRIEAGTLTLADFMRDIADYVVAQVELVQQARPESGAATSRQHEGSGASTALSRREQKPSPAGARSAPARSPHSQLTHLPPTSAASAAVARDSIMPPTRSLTGATAHDLPLQQPNAQPPLSSDPLFEALHRGFGHRKFRPHQEEICREIIAGQDLLLVMPTGAGKSLCYQLPASVRPGCAIVISPLIALMDDQVNKLRSLGIPAGALHSGLGREASRQTFRAYLDGTLKLLYIAPERLGLSGFLDLLAAHPPSLVAVDEAHCISQWGHDFRPDYRMLAQRLPRLRPAPIVGLTATATPEVQKDILIQLGLHNPSLHIHGFRRSNIAIEISEAAPSERPALVRRMLQKPGALPAIVYAPTRKETELLANLLAPVGRVAAYHAGLSAETRAGVQQNFITDQLDVIVATIAFGMGIDKSNIRSVIHTAMPSSVEAYYQEIGRAGRDGALSRAFLFYSYADHHTRLFFIKKNYPPIGDLEALLKKVPPQGILRTSLAAGKDPGFVDNALEKLWIHGAIEIDEDDMVRPQSKAWKPAYLAQQAHKENEVQLIGAFAENQQLCRMLQFLEHFGDHGDRRTPCGLCDICRPLDSWSKSFRAPTVPERELVTSMLALLRGRSTSVRRWQEAVEREGPRLRQDFDRAVEALQRAGLIWCRQESFEKDGKLIPYRSVGLTPAADTAIDWSTMLWLDAKDESAPRRKGARSSKASTRSGATTSRPRTGAAREATLELDPEHPLLQKLRGWRLRTARAERVPAYRVFADKTLVAIASERPRNAADLLAIDGIGPVKVEKYGHDILRLMAEGWSGDDATVLSGS